MLQLHLANLQLPAPAAFERAGLAPSCIFHGFGPATVLPATGQQLFMASAPFHPVHKLISSLAYYPQALQQQVHQVTQEVVTVNNKLNHLHRENENQKAEIA